MDEIRKSIVGILSKNSDHKYAGTGFFAAGGLILTCAHVVDDARTLNGQYIFIIEGQRTWQYARVVFKSHADDMPDLDIAILQPLNLPEAPAPLPLIGSRHSDGHAFTSFGYPVEGNGQGLWGDGIIHNWVRDSLGRDALQISSTKITHGFSGCPLWDDDLGGVVGMVSGGFDFGLDKKLGEVAFAIPSETLQGAHPALQLEVVSLKEPDSAAEHASANIGQNVNDSIVSTGSHNVFNFYQQPPVTIHPSTLQPSPTWHFPHTYGDSPSFTGRVPERNLLTGWLNGADATLFILRALGGFGKSALSWYWLHHDVDKSTWKQAVWWSFYEGDASFERFLTDTLTYLGVEQAAGIPAYQQVGLLLEKLRSQPILLVLDGFERALRAFSSMNAAYQGDDAQTPDTTCVSPAAEHFLRGLSMPGLRGKVLMSTRLRPRRLETHDGGLLSRCVEKELTALTAEDAWHFFQKEKINATRAEVQAACAPYAYHPLSLNLLAGLIKKDYQTPCDIRAAQKYLLTDQIKNHQAHILQLAYETLSAKNRHLLGCIACLRSGLDYAALNAMFPSPRLDESLRDLEERGLLQVSRPPEGAARSLSFDLHPIVRRYAYDRFAAPDRTQTHTLLIVYFKALPQPEKFEKLSDLAPLIELYHHTVNAGRPDEAFILFRDRLTKATYYQFGAYQLIIELLRTLFPDGENRPPRLKNDGAQAWALNTLANAYGLSGQPRRAIPLFEMANDLDEKAGNKQGLAIGLGNVAYMAQLQIGALEQAARNLRRRMELCREIEDEFKEAVVHQQLGRVLSYRGAWQAAERELAAALVYFEKEGKVQSQSVTCVYYSLRGLLLARQAQNNDQAYAALQSARGQAARALELADETARTSHPFERDYIRAHWLLGAACRALAALSAASGEEAGAAETHLSEALRRCRAINLVESEADILLELAKLRHAQGESAEALRLAGEALLISERSEYVFQGADVHLFLAVLALAGQKREEEQTIENKACALLHARRAKQLATGWELLDGKQVYDTSAEYTYKVAYDEALNLIGQLGTDPRSLP